MRLSVIIWSASLLFGLILRGRTTSIDHDAGTLPPGPLEEHQQVNYTDRLKKLIGNVFDAKASGIMRKIFSADLSTECSMGLLDFVRGIRNLEPWAIRILDASGKIPAGALQATLADLGAFDECVETVVRDDEYGAEEVRGQYCNLRLYAGNRTDLEGFLAKAAMMTHPRVEKFLGNLNEQKLPIMRLGICTLDECGEEDLQKLFRAVLPSSVDVSVTDCVTSVTPALTKGQVIIIAFLASLSLMIVLGTVVDVGVQRKFPTGGVEGILHSAVTSFSVASNTRMLLQVGKDKCSEAYCYRFLHGIRFISIVWIVLGHCYGLPSEVWSRLVNAMIYADHWENVFIISGFQSVDTFFFLGGFLLAAGASKQRKNGVVVFVLGVARRFVRTMAPVFFVIMCIQMMPVMVSGPNAKAFFREVYKDTDEKWLTLLLQVMNYNFRPAADQPRAFGHFWYLSVDFQFFLLCFPVLLLLKRRAKCAVATFALLSLLSCSIATWQVAGNQMTPFIVALTERLAAFLETLSTYYSYPFYHGACYFAGCITFFLIQWYKEQKMSKSFQTAAWCIAIGSGVTCSFMKMPWYQTAHPTNEFGKLSLAFFDRILWSVCLSWITLACATGRGGFLCTFLSWSAFAPLSRLAFGVYVIHWPFLHLMQDASRERMFFSHFVVVSFFFSVFIWSYLLSYLLFVFCEAPAVRLSKLILEPPRNRTAAAAGYTASKAIEQGLQKPSMVVTLGSAKKEPTRSATGNNSFNGFGCKKANLTSCRL